MPDYFDEQPMARVGVAVDAGLRPVGPDGTRVHERVLVAGASIGGAVPWAWVGADAAARVGREAGLRLREVRPGSRRPVAVWERS